jgi:flagellar motor protein MotB
MLKKRYENEDDIPEAARSFYTEDSSGAWVLGIDGDDAQPASGGVDQRKYKEMRDSNIALKKQLDEVRTKIDALGDIDPTTIKAALSSLAKTQNDEELQLVQAGKLDEVVSRRTQAMQANYQKQLEALTAEKKAVADEKAKAMDRFSSVFMAEQITGALDRKKLRIRPSAKTDLLTRAKSAFAPTPDLDALAPRIEGVGLDGKEWTVDTWLDSLVDEAPHLFDGGTGGSARPGGGAGRKRYNAAELGAEEFVKAADEVNSGQAEWV